MNKTITAETTFPYDIKDADKDLADHYSMVALLVSTAPDLEDQLLKVVQMGQRWRITLELID